MRVEGWVEMCVWKRWMWGEFAKLNVCSNLKQQPALLGNMCSVFSHHLGNIYTVTIQAKLTVIMCKQQPSRLETINLQ